MSTASFGGVDVSTIGYTGDYVYADGNVMPTVRQAANGSRPLRISRVKACASGRGASRSCVLSIGGTGTSSFTIASAGGAVDTGWKTLVKQVESGDSLQSKIDADGSFYFGRGGSGTSYDSVGTPFSGKIYFAIEYAYSPAAPAAPTPVAGSGEVALSWATPSDNGDSAITGYAIEYSTDAGFAGSTVKDVGVVTSDTVTGLTPGATYYFRVAAKNAVTTGASTVGPYSSSSSVLLGTVPATPAAPTLVARAGVVAATWAAPGDGGVAIDAYRLDYSTDAGFGAYDSATLSSSARTKSIVGLTPGTTYYFRVLAHNSLGYSTPSSNASIGTTARGALDGVQSAAVHVSGGVQVEVRSDGADVPTLTLGYVALGTGSTFVSIATLPTGATSADFAAPGGPRNLALVADADGNLYVIGRRGDTEATVLAKRYARSATTTWAASGELSQALASTGNELVAFVGSHVPGTGVSARQSILLLARRAGTLAAGALSYAVLDLAAVAASSGTLFINSGSDPSWLPTPPTSATPDTGIVDVAPLVTGGTRLAVLGNGFAVVDVINGTVTSVTKAANGTATAGPWGRVVGVSSTVLAVLKVASGALSWAFYSTSGAALGSGSYDGANAYGGAFGAQWDAYADRVAGVIVVYYVADTAGARTLESIDINVATYAATTAASLSSALGDTSSTNTELRVPGRYVDERRVLVASANILSGTKSVAAYADTSGNGAPNAPAVSLVDGFDASENHSMAWAFSDPNPADAQTSYEVEVQRVSDSVNVVDTGKVTSSASSCLITAATLTNGIEYRWRARTWDAIDTEGAWSAYDAFTTSALGTLTITDPATDNPASIDVADYAVTWSYSQADGYVQTQRRVRAIRTSDDTVLSDTTMQASVATAASVALVTDVEVRLEVSIVTNAPGSPTVTATRLVTSSFSTPMQPLAVVAAGESFVTIAITNPTPTGDKPDVTSNIIERRASGTDNPWVAIAAVAENGGYNDHAVRSGVAYDYRVRGVA